MDQEPEAMDRSSRPSSLTEGLFGREDADDETRKRNVLRYQRRVARGLPLFKERRLRR